MHSSAEPDQNKDKSYMKIKNQNRNYFTILNLKNFSSTVISEIVTVADVSFKPTGKTRNS